MDRCRSRRAGEVGGDAPGKGSLPRRELTRRLSAIVGAVGPVSDVTVEDVPPAAGRWPGEWREASDVRADWVVSPEVQRDH